MSKVYMMVTITNRQLRNQFQDLFEKNEMAPVFGALGRGTADSAVLDYFGLEASEKAVYFSIVTESMWKQLRRELIIKMQIDVPGTGIAFIVPVSSIGGKKVLQYLIGGQEFEKEEEPVLKDTKYELLVAIANQGSITECECRWRNGYSCKRNRNGKSRKIFRSISCRGKRDYFDRGKDIAEK